MFGYRFGVTVRRAGLLATITVLAVLLALMYGCAGQATAPTTDASLIPTPAPTPTPSPTPTPTAEEFALIKEAWEIIIGDFVDRGELDLDALSRGAIEGMIEVLEDPYSAYIDAERYELILSSLEGSFGGIGAEVTIADGQVSVVAPIKGSPAENEGILPGDWILEVDGESTEGVSLNEAVLMIRGEQGTEVTLRVLHRGEENPVDIVITRETIDLDSVYLEILPDGIAYIAVTSFSYRTPSEMTSALKEALASDATGIVLDLRDNAGGVLTSAVAVTSQFIDEGMVLYAMDSEGERDTWEADEGGLAVTLPLAVLLNGNSASASEVVAGALQDHGRARLIGTTTFGKGSVNHIRQLSDGSAIYITVERWYTPGGRRIEGNGIAPDEEIVITAEDVDQGLDPQLERAIEYIKPSQNPGSTVPQ